MSISFLRRGIALLAVYALSLVTAPQAWSFSARLTWVPVSDAAGYRLYLRENGGAYGPPVELGLVGPDSDGKVRYVVDQLDETVANGFAVTSYDATWTSESPRSNEITITYATVAAVIDSDHDGLLDALEDRDLDTVVDPGETDRLRADTDGDGISDGLEILNGTNPLGPNLTATPARTATPVPSATATPVRSATVTPVPSATATPVRSATVTPVPSATATPVRSATATPVPSATVTPVPSATATATPVPSATPTAASCESATLIPPDGGTFTGTTAGTGSLAGTCALSTLAPEQVFVWIPSFSGVAKIDTCSGTATGYDTVLYVRSGNSSGGCAGDTQIACSDDVSGCATSEPNDHHGSRLRATVTAGQPYFIVVDGFQGKSGNFALHVVPPSPMPTGGVATATPIETATKTRTPTPAPTATSERTGTSIPTATPLAAPATPTATPESTAIETSAATVTPTSSRTPTPTPTGACAFPSAIPPEGGTFSGTTTGNGSGNVSGTCAATDGASETVFRWTPIASGAATIQTCSGSDTTFDTVLYVRTASCFAGPEVACNDDRSGCGSTLNGKAAGSRIDMNVTAGQSYFIVVDGADGSNGDFLLTVDPPAGTVPTPVATPDDGSDASGEASAYRCWRATSASDTALPPAPTDVRTTDLFGDTTADVDKMSRVCVPIEASGPSSSDAPVARFSIQVRDRVQAPASQNARIANAFGEIIVDVLEPNAFEVPAAIGTSPAEIAAPGADAPVAACYRVRVQDDAPGTWTFDDGHDTLMLRGPVRVCTTGDASDRVRLCYRTRVPLDDPATVWVTSPFGSEPVELGAADEICLPSKIASDPTD